MPVHVWGDDEKRMDYLFERSDKVCLGGFKRPGRGPAPREYIVEKMRWAAGRHVHWLGYCRKSALTALRPHSCDSSTWYNARKYGCVTFYLGRGRKVTRSVADRHRPEIPAMSEGGFEQMLEDADVTREQFEDADEWKGGQGAHHKITSLSWVRYIHDLRRFFGVRHFIVCNIPADLSRFMGVVERERERKAAA